MALFTDKINKQHPQTSYFQAFYSNATLYLQTQNRDFEITLSFMISRQIPSA